MGTRRICREVNRDVVVRKEERLVRRRARLPHHHRDPRGTLTQQAVRETNYGSLWIRKYFITGAEDYPAAEFFFRHTSFEPDYEPWLQAEAQMGDGGFVIGEIMPIPIMTLMVTWMGVEGLTEGLYDHTAGFESLLDALDAHYERQNQLAAEGPAEIIWWGDNVTGSIISPRLFERYIAPVYAKCCPCCAPPARSPSRTTTARTARWSRTWRAPRCR